ncbi:MAG: outer membrane lipoprotein chaperone LolA [Legionellales bacterium]|nr:outer membrane lipoprotein chaperone LolA [Legionellales bacterium]
MMKKLIGIVIVCLCQTVFADSPAQTVINYLSKVNSLTASFTQQSLGNNSNLRQNTAGTMAILRPNRFRWDILKPNKQFIIADGKSLWIYDVDLQQVTVANLQHSIGQSPALLLSGKLTGLLNSYAVSRLPNSNNSEGFSLRAKTQNATYQAVDLFFVNGIISQMRITDNLGQRSLVTFSRVQVNPRLNASIFNFQPPRGVDVIKR